MGTTKREKITIRKLVEWSMLRTSVLNNFQCVSRYICLQAYLLLEVVSIAGEIIDGSVTSIYSRY